jgi:16S rRNA (guanine966-N2)-methyltransferase
VATCSWCSSIEPALLTRIVGGRWGGRVLTVPAGTKTRPTSEKVRAALGNSLQSAGALAGAAVLDLFAGTGALGLELLSRGAASLVLVENDRTALAALRTNLATLGSDASVYIGSATTFAAATPGDPIQKFDIVVADAPYDFPDADLAAILQGLHDNRRLTPHADVILERPRRTGFTWPEPFVGQRERRYGDTVLLFGHADG